ncbi:hypothetical protein ACLBYG_22005 [Methylobacterium sp. D53M]
MLAPAPLVPTPLADAHALCAVLRGKRMRCSTEIQLQDDIASVLTAAGIAFERERWLGPETGRIDFIAGGVGLEVKVKGGAREIYRQVARYCDHREIDALVLATTRAVSLPALTKPVLILDLSRAWL